MVNRNAKILPKMGTEAGQHGLFPSRPVNQLGLGSSRSGQLWLCLYFIYKVQAQPQFPIAQVVEHPLREREVAGSKPGRAIPKGLKMVPVATLLGAQHYKASTGFSHSLLTQLTLHTHTHTHTKKKNKKKKKLTPSTWFTGVQQTNNFLF